MMKQSILLGLLLCCLQTSNAAEIYVAVAANFSEAGKATASRFETDSGHRVILIFGSTGKHYAQILNGAPYDVFLAADSLRPGLLEQQGYAVAGSRFTYAIGRLILWRPECDGSERGGRRLLEADFRHLAVANPKLAPYGSAAQEVLQKLELWQSFRQNSRLVVGENIGQAFHFVRSGNAELGFVAASQLIGAGIEINNCCWDIPQQYYTPIRQQAVLLKKSPAARRFLEFLQDQSTKMLIKKCGYETP